MHGVSLQVGWRRGRAGGIDEANPRSSMVGWAVHIASVSRIAGQPARGHAQTVLDPFVMPGPEFHAY